MHLKVRKDDMWIGVCLAWATYYAVVACLSSGIYLLAERGGHHAAFVA